KEALAGRGRTPLKLLALADTLAFPVPAEPAVQTPGDGWAGGWPWPGAALPPHPLPRRQPPRGVAPARIFFRRSWCGRGRPPQSAVDSLGEVTAQGLAQGQSRPVQLLALVDPCLQLAGGQSGVEPCT